MACVQWQEERFVGTTMHWNSKIPPALLDQFCPLKQDARSSLALGMSRLSLSSRATQSIIRTARTISDLAQEEVIHSVSICEAIEYRRYGDGDYYSTH